MSTPIVQVFRLVWNCPRSTNERELDHISKLMPTPTCTMETKNVIFLKTWKKGHLNLQHHSGLCPRGRYGCHCNMTLVEAQKSLHGQKTDLTLYWLKAMVFWLKLQLLFDTLGSLTTLCKGSGNNIWLKLCRLLFDKKLKYIAVNPSQTPEPGFQTSFFKSMYPKHETFLA